MPKRSIVVLFCSILLLASALASAHAVPATPTFKVSATNTTMPMTGFGSVPITLTSLDSYSGTIMAGCAPTSPPAGAKLPICGAPTGPREYTLTANASVNGTITLEAAPYPSNSGSTAAVTALPHRTGLRGVAGLALGVGLLFGFSLRRRTRRCLSLTLIALATLAGVAAIGACSAANNANTLTPGTFQYTVTATDINTSESVTTTVNVIVPPGVSNGL